MRSHHPSGRVMTTLFRLLLATLGAGMQLACRMSARFRAQVTRAVTVQIGSADGVFHHYVFTPRALSARAGPADAPDLSLCFDNARLGLTTLLSPHAVGRIVSALLDRSADYQGNAVLVLWFYGLTRFVVPIGRMRRLRMPPPDALLAPNPHSRVDDRIVREPPVGELDPSWQAAHRQRATMVMVRGSAGEPVRLW